MIFVLIAGTYTPVALLALKGSLASTILIVLWAGALGGVVFKLLWIDAPKWLFAGVYVALGLVTAAVFGELPAAIGWLGVAGLATGGLLYVLGAIVYASGRPNPWPKVFGYHEIFHALVIAAAALAVRRDRFCGAASRLNLRALSAESWTTVSRPRLRPRGYPGICQDRSGSTADGWDTSSPARIRGKQGCGHDTCAVRGAAS